MAPDRQDGTDDLRADLELAVRVAREAGAMIRDEFLRPGGPRGTGGHAEIDQPAEEFIRERLLSARPAYAYLGEETGDSAGSGKGAARRWIVDPNDGTRDFLKGKRGPSVSIALVRDSVPVLGVVYAYAAPDDRGDLIAGGAGLGLVRGPGEGDGEAIVTAAQPEGPPPADTIAVSSSAADDPETWAANTERCAPWTPLPIPGIAYRLALTAVGECRIATTLTGPVSWDMAGGHALLRAAGKDLYTREGAPVRYTGNGNCSPSSSAYFGGRREHVMAVLDREWESLLRSRPRP